MEVAQFKALVARLERESAVAPGAYRLKVAALTLLGFLVMAVLLGTVGLGLLLIVALVAVMVFSGGSALILVLKFAKLLLILVIPLWFMVKAGLQALFVRLPAPPGREITRAEAPALFDALDAMRTRMNGPRFHHVLIDDSVNAAVVQRPAFGMVGWPRNHLLLGLPLLEALPAPEALAVVAHEYGHLAGSHGHFSAFIYRLRHTWGTVQACVEQIQGWLARLVSPLVRWYVPYFNAYTFVLARADEYQADAASAALVGAEHTVRALKRVNLVASQHERFMQKTFDRIDHDAVPPGDLSHRWAAQALQAPEEGDARRWLADALDREGHYADTHPTLRARLQALPACEEPIDVSPPPVGEHSAAQAWLGPLVEQLRGEFQSQWREQVAAPWSIRHAEAQQERVELDRLRGLASCTSEERLEQLRLTMRLEPDADLRDDLAAFNAQHADHAMGLFLEASSRLHRDDDGGLPLLARVVALDPDATKPVAERAHAFLSAQKRSDEAEAWAERWRRRDEFERVRAVQLEHVGAKDPLVHHGLDPDTMDRIRAALSGPALKDVAEVYVARRPIPIDPDAVQIVLGVYLTWWGRTRSRQHAVVDRLAALKWPVHLVVLSLDGMYAPLRKALKRLPGATID